MKTIVFYICLFSALACRSGSENTREAETRAKAYEEIMRAEANREAQAKVQAWKAQLEEAKRSGDMIQYFNEAVWAEQQVTKTLKVLKSPMLTEFASSVSKDVRHLRAGLGFREQLPTIEQDITRAKTEIAKKNFIIADSLLEGVQATLLECDQFAQFIRHLST